MKNTQRSSFKLNPIAAAIAIAMASQFTVNVAYAGAGWGDGIDITKGPVKLPTYYANSPAGPAVALDPVTGLTTKNAVTQLPGMGNTGKALRKFVDTLPGIGSANANNLGQYIPLAVAEKNWVNPATGAATADDYYEIAAVEYSEKMHSDLVKATHLRGYVQLETAGNAATSKHIALTYPVPTGAPVGTPAAPILDATRITVANPTGQVYAYDNPHHLGPIINSTTGTAVRVKFTNYLPVGTGGELFIPVDTTVTGAGASSVIDPITKLPINYKQNRAEIHLVGGSAPWISSGTPHQWVAPAGEAAAYAAGLGKGASTQNVPDMADPGNGSTTLYFPNDISARFTFYQDRTSGLTRLNSYAGLEAGYMITDLSEQNLIKSGAIPADQIPLIIEDKTFVPGDIAQQDAKWDLLHWGQPGDLWFPHVYETNQDPASINGVNPVGRWDWGPWFWPIFPNTQPLPNGSYGSASFTPEAFMDTPLVNGTAYPSLTVDPKAYRFRILNASNDRYINLGLYKADATAKIAPQLDQNGNPIVDQLGNQLYFTNTEVRMVPALADVTGAPLVPTSLAATGLAYDPACLCQYPTLAQNINAAPSGPTRAWPIDGRRGGAPDPAAVGPDFIAIGNDGGFLPNPVDIPSQPVTYEANRRSITVSNIYGYGLLLGPSERSDAIVDFSAYAGQTLILYNDAPAPVPFNDERLDYYTGNPDQSGIGGAYSTKAGYGPNTRTMMQIVVRSANTAVNGVVPPISTYSPTALLTALPAAYGASQPTPNVPESAYNAAFHTTDVDLYAHVATGSAAQPTLDFSTTGALTITSFNVIPAAGSGTGYLSAPLVTLVGGVDLNVAGNKAALATATIDPKTGKVIGVTLDPANPGVGYTTAPSVLFTPTNGGVGASAAVVTSNFKSIRVDTKAEQELFDASGRYNSTGGVELPFTTAVNQTTVPLNYIDSATEIIGDNEVQIWKIVDNGLFTNSIHFDFVDVQLINRVGWDGTVKAPSSNELGWKDTLRLNPLEDVVLAIRAKRATIPFGLPASSRRKDPSKALGVAGSGLGFTVDPGVVSPAGVALLTSATNSIAQYDNEFAWYSAILSHSEDDLMRPIVFHPTVTIPAAPTSLAGGTTALGGSTGVLTWIDPTPAGQLASLPGAVPVLAATLANPQNEIGFKVLRATFAANGTLGAYAQLVSGTAPANATSYTDATQVAGTDYSYEVAAWNAAGAATSAPVTAITAPASPTFGATPVAINAANGVVTVTWNKVAGATGYILTANGVAGAVIPATAGGTTQSATFTPPLALNASYSITVTAQKVRFGSTATSAASLATTANLTMPAAPAAPVMAATTFTTAGRPTLHWTAVAGASGYLVSVNGGAAVAVNGGTTAAYQFPATPAAGSLALGSSYNVTVAAQITKFGVAVPSTTPAPVTVDLTTPTPAAPTGLILGTQTATRAPLSWTAVAGATGYVVQVSTNGGAYATSSTITSGTTVTASPTIAAGNSYSFQVLATQATYGVTKTSATASNVVNVITLPAASSTPVAAAGAVGSKSITVTWTNTSSNITGWTVQRRLGTVWTTITPVVAKAGTTYSFTDTGLAAGSYAYRLLATSAVGSTPAVITTATASNAVVAP